jgi:hypothetical protein
MRLVPGRWRDEKKDNRDREEEELELWNWLDRSLLGRRKE